MWPNPQENADFVTLTEENLNGKLCAVYVRNYAKNVTGCWPESEKCFMQ